MQNFYLAVSCENTVFKRSVELCAPSRVLLDFSALSTRLRSASCLPERRKSPWYTPFCFDHLKSEEKKKGEHMKEKVAVYFDALERLSTEELDRSAKNLVIREKKNLACVIAHLAEISKRKAHLECGYKSLFEYCVRRLNLSEGSVYRRIQVAKVCREFPQVLVHLAEGRVSLTVARGRGVYSPAESEGGL